MVGISSVQFSSLVNSLSDKLVQFSSGHWGQVPRLSSFSSVHLVQFTTISQAIARVYLTGSVRVRLGSVHRVSNYFGEEELF